MTITDAELKDLVGKAVSTPDGNGKVAEVGDRYITVELANKTKAKFSANELTVIDKKK